MSDKQQDMQQQVRLHAHLLWQYEGCPDGRADEHWLRASELER
jgi:hypothetical protein